MIEPPTTIKECQDVIKTFQAMISADSSDVYTVAAKLAAMLNELEALRVIVKNLAASQPQNDDGRCVLCSGLYGEHDADCLISRARKAMKQCTV